MKNPENDPRLVKIADEVAKKIDRSQNGDTTMSLAQVVTEGLIKAYEIGQIDTWLKRSDDKKTEDRNSERRRRRDG